MNYSNSAQRLRPPKTTRTAESETVFSVETDKRGTHLRVRKVATLARRAACRIAVALFMVTACFAQITTIDFNSPTFDKNGYPFSSEGGGPRSAAFVFGAIGSPGEFDDRDSQMIVGFSTGGVVPSGRGQQNYTILSATFTLSLDFSAADLVVFDGTYDPISSYTSTGEAEPGDDLGRSIELYGVGYRNGFTATSISETTPIIAGDNPLAEDSRNIFATDFVGGVARDVSNNIRDAFDTVPFAIGQVAPADLNPDGTIKDNANIVFTLNLANPDVVAYLKNALNVGRLNLIASSLHLGAQGEDVTYPVFQTKETLAAVPARLDMQVIVVPEPRAGSLAIVGAAVFACWRNRRRLTDPEELP